ncbi:hypothetical protein [uncultured Bacteroides sp.]|uniref:hypothetical protein n=1 Tax=uncultured Bacteroides sp. TaxID=162156 RepID=UPI0025DF84D9|nr:hypothetical protein [uncultured Bacteroides sp.]
MKKLLFLFLLVLCCACEEDKSVDPTLMPEATTSGQNTLGCLIDGWVYTSGRFGKPDVSTYDEEGSHYVRIAAEVGVFSALHFTLVNPRQGAACTYINASFDGEKLEDGEAYITRMNGTIISGTFSGGNIREGRFDIRYSDESEGDGGIY